MPNFLWPTASNPDHSPATSAKRFHAPLAIAASALATLCLLTSSCSSPSYDDPEEVLTPGTISFPFSYEPERIGREGRHGDKLVVKSIAGKSEYVIELPDEGDNYDIEVPTATFDSQAANPYRKFKNPSATDRELVDQMPQLSPSAYRQRQQIEAGLGLSEKGGPGQSPSYIVGLAEINELYRQRELELALVKTNNLIIHYPNSSKLHKMKGTLLIKLRNFPLAQRAWTQAARLDPGDKLLQRGLIRLEERIKAESRQPAAPAPVPAAAKPTSNALPQPNPGELPVGRGENAASQAETAKGANAANPVANTADTATDGANNAANNAANNTLSNSQQGMSPKGFSDGLAPRNVPDEPRNALLPTPERNGTNEDAIANGNGGDNELTNGNLANGNLANGNLANGNLANGNLSSGNNFAPGSGNGAAPGQENGLGQRPPDVNTGSNLFDGNPDTAAEQKPPNVWRNNGSNPAN